MQERLGHKSILTTMLYTHLINFEADNYHSATAQTLDEAKKLVEAGFEYVTDMGGGKVLRKRKWRQYVYKRKYAATPKNSSASPIFCMLCT